VHHLYVVNPGSGQDTRQVLYGILGKAVADEEDAQVGRHVEGRVGRGGAGSDVNGDGVVARTVAVLLNAKVAHFIRFGVDIPNGGTTIVGSHAAGSIAAVEHRGLVHVTEEDTAAGILSGADPEGGDWLEDEELQEQGAAAEDSADDDPEDDADDAAEEGTAEDSNSSDPEEGWELDQDEPLPFV